MKKITLLILFGLAHYFLLAQDAVPCSEWQLKTHQHAKKKTRAGAADNVLMGKYDVRFYFLDLNIERNSTIISGSTTISSTVTAPNLDTFAFELNNNLVIDSIMANNQNLTYTRISGMSYAVLPNSLLQNADFSVTIYYHGDASIVGASAIGDGFATDVSPSWGNEVTWSLSEPYSAYEWFPCKQFLQDKADSAWVFITTDAANKAGSNGVLEGIDTGLPNNKVRYRWKTHYMIDYYLISVAVSKYVDYSIYAHPNGLPNDSIQIQNYVYDNPATLNAFKSKIDSIPMVLEYFSDLFGLYPFYEEKYGHCMAPIGGGMEHQTMSTMGNLGSFRVNAHELLHQWFGDHVTCKTWKDIFINEGFASYGEYLAYERFRSYQAAQNLMLNVHDDVLQDPNAMVYFTDTTNTNRIFDGRLTYNKGNAVLHTLRFVLGDTLFFNGLKHFQTTYSFSTATIDDLKNDLQNFTGVNLNDYFNQWLYGEGYPTYSAEYFSNGTNLFLKVTHSTSSAVTPLFKTPLEIKCVSAGGDTIIKVDITQNSNTYIIPTTKTITDLQFDPNNWLLNKDGSVTVNPTLVSLSSGSVAFENAIQIYPNPCIDEIILQSSMTTPSAVEVRDIAGRLILQEALHADLHLNTSSWSKGIYFITVNHDSMRVVRKVVKE